MVGMCVQRWMCGVTRMGEFSCHVTDMDELSNEYARESMVGSYRR